VGALGPAELVAQIGFTETTGDGRLRRPRFLGLRRNTRLREVVFEARRDEGP
jgi:ATP-dependent DNA ligase